MQRKWQRLAREVTGGLSLTLVIGAGVYGGLWLYSADKSTSPPESSYKCIEGFVAVSIDKVQHCAALAGTQLPGDPRCTDGPGQILVRFRNGQLACSNPGESATDLGGAQLQLDDGYVVDIGVNV